MKSQTIVWIDPEELLLGFEHLTNEEMGCMMDTVFMLADDHYHHKIALAFPFVVKIKQGKELISRLSMPPSMRKAVFERDGRECAYCGSDDRLEIDHIKPYILAQEHKLENLQILCKPCNMKKGATYE